MQNQKFDSLVRQVYRRKKLILTPIESQDQELFVRLYTDPRVTQHIGIHGHGDLAHQWFAYAIADMAKRQIFYWVLRECQDNIGFGVVALQCRASSIAELGVLIEPAYWQQGFGLIALSLLRDKCFHSGLFTELWLRHAPANQAMAALAQSCGFAPERLDNFQHWNLTQVNWQAQRDKNKE